MKKDGGIEGASNPSASVLKGGTQLFCKVTIRETDIKGDIGDAS